MALNLPSRDSLLDDIEATTTISVALQKRCEEFTQELARWTMLREQYFVPLLNEAVRNAMASMSNNVPANFPLRNDTDDCGSAEDGLPPERETPDETEVWLGVYNAEVLLPSSYVAVVRSEAVLRDAVELELECRRAEAGRALEDLRTVIIGSEVLKMNKKFTTGKSLTTRAQSKIQTANNEVRKAANLYRRHWVALVVLGMDRNDPVYRRLVKNDVKKFVMSSDTPELGKSRRAESWIWEDVSWVDGPQDDRYKEFYRDGKHVVLSWLGHGG